MKRAREPRPDRQEAGIGPGWNQHMMRVRDRVGLNFPPLLLRLMLGIIFLWAGMAKVSSTMEVKGEEAAKLANMGVLTPAATATPPAPTGPSTAAPAQGPAIRLVSQTSAGRYTAADFPNPVRVTGVYGVALVVHSAANPPAAEAGGKVLSPYWPPAIGQGSWPVYLAWAVTITELGGGLCVLVGLFTRLWALGLTGVMLGAMWLTQLGPNIQAGNTVLGFLPAYPRYGQEWTNLTFQFSLFMAAAALAFLGPGRASLDHLLLGGRTEDDDDEE